MLDVNAISKSGRIHAALVLALAVLAAGAVLWPAVHGTGWPKLAPRVGVLGGWWAGHALLTSYLVRAWQLRPARVVLLHAAALTLGLPLVAVVVVTFLFGR